MAQKKNAILYGIQRLDVPSSSGSKSVGGSDYFDVSYDVSGEITVDYETTLKFGGQAGLEAQISLDPLGLSKFKFYVAAGFGFDMYVDIVMAASAELCLKGDIENDNIFWVGITPILTTFQTSISFCLNVDSAFQFQFHTGIGEYSHEYKKIKKKNKNPIEIFYLFYFFFFFLIFFLWY